MRLGIRKKLVGLLTLVALVPLTAALITFTIVGRRLRIESMGETIRAMASAHANALSLSLVKDVERLRLDLAYHAEDIAELAARAGRLPAARLAKLDADWPELSLTAEPMANVLNNAVAKHLREIQREDNRLAEVLITDRHGQLVAATGRTSDFNQADEDWWQDAYDQGRDCPAFRTCEEACWSDAGC